MKKTWYAIFVGIIMMILTACGTSEADQSASPSGNPPEKNSYLFGVDAKYPPFEFEKDGKYVGIDIDLLQAIAEEEGITIEIKPMDFKGIIPAILAGQLDGAAAGISITDERKQVVLFSEPYYKAGLSLVVKEDNTTITGPDDLKGKKIAIKKGTTGAKFAEQLAQQHGAQVTHFNDSPSMFLEVENENADVTIEDYPVIAYKLAQDPKSKLKIIGDRLNGDNYGIAISKDNAELHKKIDSGLKKLRENGKYNEIIKKWTGTN